MKRFSTFASIPLSAGLTFASVADLHGVVADARGLPLAGVVVRLVSSSDSAVSAADGSWSLARTASLAPRPSGEPAGHGNLALFSGKLRPRIAGFGLDGRRPPGEVPLGTSPKGGASPRAASTTDTLQLRWKGLVVKIPVANGTQGDLGRAALDTSGLNQLEIRSSRFSLQDLSGIHLEILNLDSIPHDSLTLRFHLEGTAAEMADFGANLEMATHYTVSGFYTPAGLDPSPISRAHPRLADPLCPVERSCPWTFDLPLFPMAFPVMSRYSVSLVFRRHLLTGDSSRFINLPPTHDPFAGRDWSFRAHGTGPSLVYPGVPALDPAGPPVAPVHPYVQLVRGTKVLYGRGPIDPP